MQGKNRKNTQKVAEEENFSPVCYAGSLEIQAAYREDPETTPIGEGNSGKPRKEKPLK